METKCTITFELTDNEKKKMDLDAHFFIGSDGRLIAETNAPLNISTLKTMNFGSHDAFIDTSSIFALKDDIETVLDIIGKYQESGDICEFNDDSKEGLAINRLNDMLDGIIYPIFIEKLSHQYPILIKNLNKAMEAAGNYGTLIGSKSNDEKPADITESASFLLSD